jgi:hypothetical protein
VGLGGGAGVVLCELVEGLVQVRVPLESFLRAEEASLDVELDTGWTLELGWLAKAWGLARGGLLLRVLGSLGELHLRVVGGLLGHVAGDLHVHLGDLSQAGSLGGGAGVAAGVAVHGLAVVGVLREGLQLLRHIGDWWQLLKPIDLILIPSAIDLVSSATMLGTAGSFTLSVRGV